MAPLWLLGGQLQGAHVEGPTLRESRESPFSLEIQRDSHQNPSFSDQKVRVKDDRGKNLPRKPLIRCSREVGGFKDIALLLLLPCTPSTHEQLSNDSKEHQLSMQATYTSIWFLLVAISSHAIRLSNIIIFRDIEKFLKGYGYIRNISVKVAPPPTSLEYFWHHPG